MDYVIHRRRWERERKEGVCGAYNPEVCGAYNPDVCGVYNLEVCGAYNPEVVEYLLVEASYLKKVNSKDNNSKMEKIAVSNYRKTVVYWCFLLCDVCLPAR